MALDPISPAKDPSTNEKVHRVIRVRDEGEPDSSPSPDHVAKVREFIRTATKRFTLAKEAEDIQRTRSLEEVEFDSGQHWDAQDQQVREGKDQVVIQINRTPQYLQQVGNQQRMTRPVINIKPNGGGADEETAKINKGIIQSIENKSHASDIRDDAFYRMLQKGWTYWRVNVEWENEKSFKRVIRTGRFDNDFSVYCDPSCLEPDRSDSNFYFVVDDIPVEQYKIDYPNSKLAGLIEFTSTGDYEKNWVGDTTIRVAEYWYREREEAKLYAMADDPFGTGFFEDELQKDENGNLIGVAKDDQTGKPIFRMSFRDKIYWSRINAVEVLDGNEDLTAGRETVPGAKYIPIIFCYGRRILVKKRPIWVGMVRDAMEPCLAMDYWLSAITEMVALGPKAPWVVAYESIAEYKIMWDSSNLENYAALFYDKYDADGREHPAPFRSFGEPPIASMKFILEFAEEDLKKVMGIYNRSLGQSGPEHSGTAIRAVQQQGDVANFNYVDNQGRAIDFEARVYLDLMKKVYTAPQAIEIIRPEGDTDTVFINKEFQDPKNPNKKLMYTVNGGDYAVDVQIGPSARTRMQEAFEGMTEYLRVDPTAAPLIGDLLAKSSDYPDKDELAKRLRSRVPPEALQEEGKDAIPPAIKAKYTKQSQMIEQLTQQLHTVHDAIAAEERKFEHERQMKAMELSSNERVAKMRVEAQVETSKFSSQKDRDIASGEMVHDLMTANQEGPMEFTYKPGVGLQIRQQKQPPAPSSDAQPAEQPQQAQNAPIDAPEQQ